MNVRRHERLLNSVINSKVVCSTEEVSKKVVMKGDTEIVDRLPDGWKKLFVCLNRSIELADLWYLEATQSSYGHKPEWQTLLTSLQVQEPCVVDGQLVFKPRFLMLKQCLKEKFLKFMINESCVIPDRAILKFVRSLQASIEPERDDRISQLVAKLKQEIKINDDFTQKKKKDQQSTMDPTEQTETVKDSNSNMHEGVICIDVDEIGEDSEPAAKRQKLDPGLTDSAEQDSQIIATQTDSLNDTKLSQFLEDSDVDITDEVDEKMEKLKEIWQSGDDSNASEVLKEIPKLSLKEIEWFCKRIGFSEMSDDSIEVVCNHLCQLVDSLSYDSVVCLLQYVVLETVLKITQAPSRKLTGAVTLVAETFPKQFIESTLVPLCSQECVSSCHAEVVCKIIKDKLSLTLRTFLIKKLFTQNFVITNDKMPILQTIFDNGFDANEEVVSLLILSFSNVAQNFAKDLKFGKLLLALINKYGKRFTAESKVKFCSTVDGHATFLKKSITNALNKLK